MASACSRQPEIFRKLLAVAAAAVEHEDHGRVAAGVGRDVDLVAALMAVELQRAAVDAGGVGRAGRSLRVAGWRLRARDRRGGEQEQEGEQEGHTGKTRRAGRRLAT